MLVAGTVSLLDAGKMEEAVRELVANRSLATIDLLPGCGVDLPRIAYDDLVGESSPPPATMNGAGKRWAITLLPGERPALQRPPYVDGVFARDDPKPWAVHLARVVRNALR